MSISGLSNHLCCVVAVAINLLAGSSLFRPACATTNHYEFVDSRQFKRNLAVSKYRNNTYWLPNYKWSPPEKSNGPRKKPLWEVKQVPESGKKKKERIELEEWDKKMREVTKREREKWKKESDKSVSNDELHNGRWGTSASLNSDTTRPGKEGVNVPVTFSNGRWGMSVKEMPEGFLSEISADSIPRRTMDRLKNEMGATTSMSPAATTKDRPWNDQPDTIERSDVSMGYEKQKTKPETHPSGHWSMSMEDAPNENIKSRRSHQTFKIHNGARERDEDEAGNMKFDSVEKGRRKMTNTKGGRALTKLSMELPSSRWGSNESSPLWKFLREISRCGHLRAGECHENGIWQELFRSIIPKNVHRSRELPFIMTPSVSYKLFLQFFPRISRIQS